MSDVDLVLGAKDQTDAGFKSVDASLNRLQASARVATQAISKTTRSAFGSMVDSFGRLQDRAKAARESLSRIAQPAVMTGMAKATKSAVSSMSDSFGRLKAAAGPLFAIWAGIKAVQGANAAIGAINDAYDMQTEAVEGLTTALRINGDEVEVNSAEMQEFASYMQKLTGVGDEVTLGLMRQASMLGVSEENLEEVAKASIGLAEATGKELTEALNLARLAVEGDFGSIGEVIPAVRTMTTDTEKLSAVCELAAKGLDAKAAAADRLSGMTDRAKGAIGDMMEQVGALLAPLRLLIAQGLKAFAESATNRLIPAVAAVNAMFERVTPVMDAIGAALRRLGIVFLSAFQVIGGIVSDVFGEALTSAGASFQGFAGVISDASRWVAEKVLFAITVLEVGWQNLPSVLTLVAAKLQLILEGIRADIEHKLTKELPTYALWFAANFPQIIQAGTDAAMDVVADFGLRLGEAMGRIMQFIQSGMQGGIGGLTTSLSEIAARRLEIDFAAAVGALPEIMGRALTEREVQLQDQVGALGANLGAQFSTKFSERMAGLGEEMGEELVTDMNLQLEKGSVAKAGSTLQASESRLLTRGTSDDPLLNVNKQQAETLKSIDGRLKENLDQQNQPQNRPNLEVEMVA